ncbi:hypothetical protein Cpa01nite_32120 [Cellulomonas pakistanensis]|uniref:Uncharacterized protein n=1 Tax=Cellulomonas pakistanensis TaxID=992287 RepID=A0A919PDS9_9CELL|nr:hypothetical protein Cpa01nite_32120 [Cellulomonas pakistanensis]
MQDDQADPVRHDVVQLAGEPGALGAAHGRDRRLRRGALLVCAQGGRRARGRLPPAGEPRHDHVEQQDEGHRDARPVRGELPGGPDRGQRRDQADPRGAGAGPPGHEVERDRRGDHGRDEAQRQADGEGRAVPAQQERGGAEQLRGGLPPHRVERDAGPETGEHQRETAGRRHGRQRQAPGFVGAAERPPRPAGRRRRRGRSGADSRGACRCHAAAVVGHGGSPRSWLLATSVAPRRRRGVVRGG